MQYNRRHQASKPHEDGDEGQTRKMQRTFQPHAIILAERTVPSPIFVAAIFGVDRILRIDFDPDQPPITYVKQTLAGIRRKLAEFQCAYLPGVGQPIGFVVNYSADRAVSFDLQCNALEILPAAYRTGKASMSVGP